MAATRAITEGNTHLVLVGYPLRNEGGEEDKVLRHLLASIKILFVNDDVDGECEKLESVCKESKCQKWKIGVQGANQALKVESPETGTKKIIIQDNRSCEC